MTDQFPPFQKFNTSFIVENIITDSNKRINIFQYPISVGKQRDLLAIPGVSEGDIRASLLKGEILHKLKAKEIRVVFSDIDLLQFNDDQKVFLRQAGIMNGLQVGPSNMEFTREEDIQLDGVVDNSNTVFKIPSGTFIQDSVHKIIPYINGVKQFYIDDYYVAESGGTGSGYDTVIFMQPPQTNPSPVDVVTADYYQANY